MNKSEFLNELKKRINLLEDDEQQDIIDEYSQHIDNKVSKGMTEAEAIEDFGSFDQLVEELLGAYHVKASAVEKATGFNASSLVDGGKRAAEKAVDATKKGCSKLKQCWDKLDDRQGQVDASEDTAVTGNDFAGVALENASGTKTGRAKSALDKTVRAVKNAGKSAAQGGSSLWSSTIACAKTLVRWCWNLCIICMAACIAFCALCGLFSLGFCLVMLVQGYPLAGVSLAALGASVALTCLSVLCIQLVLLKKRPEKRGSSPAATPQAANAVRDAKRTWTDGASQTGFVEQPTAPMRTNLTSQETAPMRTDLATGTSTDVLTRETPQVNGTLAQTTAVRTGATSPMARVSEGRMR